MSEPEGIQWGIIGCGDVTETKSGPAFSLVDNSRLVAVMRRDGEKAADYAHRHNVPHWFDNAQALIEHPEVNAVYIATPPGSHMDYALAVCAAGKPAYVEKPMARSYRECIRMNDAFDHANIPLFVAYYRRGFARFNMIKQLIADGALGELTGISYRHSSAVSQTTDLADLPWRLDPPQSGGGVFVDIGCHALDLLDHVFGPLGNVRGTCASSGLIPGVEDQTAMVFETELGVLGTGSWNFAGYIDEDILEVHGAAGRISTSIMSESPIDIVSETLTDRLTIPNPKHVQGPLIESVVSELLGIGICPSTGASAARTSKIIDTVLWDFYGGRDDEFWMRPRLK
jgi:predicted dehydrogenase